MNKEDNELIVEQEGDNIIELENKLISLREQRFPLQQQVGKLNHDIEQIKSKIKVANLKYWENRGK